MGINKNISNFYLQQNRTFKGLIGANDFFNGIKMCTNNYKRCKIYIM